MFGRRKRESVVSGKKGGKKECLPGGPGRLSDGSLVWFDEYDRTVPLISVPLRKKNYKHKNYAGKE